MLSETFPRILGIVVLGVCLIVAGHGFAQAPAPGGAPAGTEDAAPLSQQELRDLIATLNDDEARGKLIARLEVLAGVNAEIAAEEPPTATGLGTRLLGGLSERISWMSRELVEAARFTVDMPRLWQRTVEQFTVPEQRAQWLRALWQAAFVIVLGLFAGWLLRRLLGRMRAAMEARADPSLWVRFPLLLARAALDLVPIAGFVVAAHVAVAVVGPAADVRAVVLSLIQAIAVAQVVMVAARIVLAPHASGLRLPPIADEDANYLFIWVRRLTNVAVYGYFIAETARLTGVPEAGATALLHLVGLFFFLITVVFVMQNRQTVAGWLRGAGTDRQPVRRLRDRVADVWHVLAILYLTAMFMVWVLSIEDGFRFILTATLLSALILAITRLAILTFRRALHRVFRLRDDVRESFPGLQARTNRYLPIMESIGIVIIDLIAIFALLEAWGVDSFAWLASPMGQRLAGSALAIGGFVLVAVIVWEGASAAIERYMERRSAGSDRLSTRARTLLPLFRTALLILLVTLVTLVTLSELGVNIAPLLAGAGVVGLAIGFGAQTLVKDIITGIFILMEDQIAVGDVVKVGSHAGLVEELTLRTVRMRSLDGNVHVIPYSEVSTVENMTKDFSRYVFNVGVAYREDTDQVVEVLREIGAEMQEDEEFRDAILEPLEILGVEGFGDSAVFIRARFTTRPIQQWRVGREFNRRMKKKFDELGIEIPFPHRTLYFGELKGGGAPPAFVRLGDRDTQPAGDVGGQEPESPGAAPTGEKA
jgi:moderate conductance mechanosensitive channel